MLTDSAALKDVIKRDVDDGTFFSYQLHKTKNTEQPQSFQSDIDPSCSPGYCGFNFQHADDLTDPLCWLKLAVLAILAGYLTTYLLESLFLDYNGTMGAAPSQASEQVSFAQNMS